MCGRFYVAEDEENELLAAMIREASRKSQARIGAPVAVGEVTPASPVAALALGKTGAEGAFPMLWGYHRPEGKGLLINTRSETALQKPMFRDSMLHRRCLLPLSWYFEWERRDRQKIKYAIRPRGAGLLYLAGIYRFEEGQPLPVCSVLTQDAAPEIAFIHPRMPVIFSEENRKDWLRRDADPARVLAACQKQMTYRAAE